MGAASYESIKLPMREPHAPLPEVAHQCCWRRGLISRSGMCRITVSRERSSGAVNRTISPASNSIVRRGAPFGWTRARRRHKQRFFLARQLARGAGARLLVEDLVEITFHELALGSIHDRPVDPDAARNCLIRHADKIGRAHV